MKLDLHFKDCIACGHIGLLHLTPSMLWKNHLQYKSDDKISWIWSVIEKQLDEETFDNT